MTNPAPNIRMHAQAERHEGRRERGQYLPSAQVLAELAALGPDLERLATDLRDRLSGPSAGKPPNPRVSAAPDHGSNSASA